jgi:hypothetical protein
MALHQVHLKEYQRIYQDGAERQMALQMAMQKAKLMVLD